MEYDESTLDDAVVTVDYEVVTIRSWFNTVEQPDRGFNFQRSDYNLVTLFLDRKIDTAGGKFNAACFPPILDEVNYGDGWGFSETFTLLGQSLVFRTTSIPLQDMELRKMRLKVFIFKSKLHYVKSTLGA